MVAQRAALGVAQARRMVRLQRAGLGIIQDNVRYHRVAVGPGIHHQVGSIIPASARVQGRASVVAARAQRQCLDGAELAVHIGQQLQGHAAHLIFRQGQHQVGSVLLAGQVGQQQLGVALADDGGDVLPIILIHHAIAVTLGAAVADDQLLGLGVFQVGSVEVFYFAGQAFHRAADPPAVFAAGFQHSQADVGAGGVGSIQHSGFVLTVTVPIAKGKGRQEITAGRVF